MSNPLSILIVEDEKAIRTFISTVLTANGYRPIETDKGREALSIITSHCPDVILLDLGLPDMDGLDLLKTLRQWSQVPVIVVSARAHEKEKVEALDLGADDYVVKPFGASELLARIRTAIKHSMRQGSTVSGSQPSGKIISGKLSIDFDKRSCTVEGRDVHLTQTEFKIVMLLAKYSGRVLTYDFIINNIWGPFAERDNQILRVNMANIRRKIEQNPAEPQFILTEVGVGYRMADSEQ